MKGFEALGAGRIEIGKPWPCRLVVIEQDAVFLVVAVEHHRRRPGYWTARLHELGD